MKSLLCLILLSFVTSAFGQGYPSRPVRVVVNFPPGGVADQIARVLAPYLQQATGQPFVVENRSGGNGNIGASEVARAPADGYTLLLTPSGVLTVNGLLYPLPFDPMRAFDPIASQAVVNVFLVVKPGLPANTAQEFIALARGGRLTFGTPGTGSSPHLAAELFKRQIKVDALHVPYKGAAPALTDLLGGQIDFMFDPGIALPHIRSGKLRLLAVGSPRRNAAFPAVPTVSEVTGEEFDAGTIFGLVAPAGTPRAAIARLSSEVGKAMQTPEMSSRIGAMGADALFLATDAYAERLQGIHRRMGALVRDTGMKPE